MPRLVYVVDVNSDDEDTDVEYLQSLQQAFVNITDLANFGYSGDEIFARSRTGIRDGAECRSFIDSITGVSSSKL